MAVAHSTVSESHTGAIGSISQASFTWNHAAAANPFGVLVFVHNMSGSTDKVTAVTYGGVALAAVAGGRAVDAATEPGDCQAWFLGDASTIPSGTQSVVVTRTNDTDELYAVCITVVATAGMDTAVHEAGIVLLQGDGTLAEQSVTDGSPGANSVRYASGFSGLAAFPPTGASSTDLSNFDTGNQTVATVRETTAGQGARNVGFASGTSDDRAFVHLAVKEITASDPQLVTPGTASLITTPFAPTVTATAHVSVTPGLANPGSGSRDAVLADSPVAYYRLGEASGTNANDDTANANDGTYTNTPTLGVAGAMTDDTAVTLASASSEYVTAPNTTANNIVDASFTLEGWIRGTATPAGFAHLISKADSGVAVGYCLRTNGDGLALVGEVNIGGTGVSAVYSGGGVWNGVWHHVVVRYDGANLSIWFDGVMAGNPAATANVTDSSAKPLNIGASGDASNFFAGSIDEVALYATALSATRILAHYNARSLTLTTFAPTVTVESAAITVIMGTASVALSTFAPTVLTPVLVTPATAALTIATMIPSVTFGIRVTMGLAALATSTFTPSVTVSDHILATVGAASMTITAFAPSSLTPQVITMTNASIVTATFAPSVLLPIVVTMNVASLSTSTFAPSVTVGAGVVATLFTASIVTASFAPTIVNPQSATMGRATLTLATFVPSANITVLVTMNTATLTTASFVPTVSTPQTITIDKLTMTTATFVPTVSTPQLVTMTTASLITTPFVPAVTASNNVLVSMNPASMVITTYTMTVYTGGGTFGEAVAVVVRRQPNVAGASQSGEITATVIRRVN